MKEPRFRTSSFGSITVIDSINDIHSLSQNVRQRLAVRLCFTLVIRGDPLRGKGQEDSLPVSIVKPEQQRPIFVDAVVKLGQTALVHVNVMDTRAIGRSKDVRGSLLVDRVSENGVEFVKNVIVGTRYIVRKDSARFKIDKVLRTNVVKTLQGGLLPTDQTFTVAMLVMVAMALVVRRALAMILGGRVARRTGLGQVETLFEC